MRKILLLAAAAALVLPGVASAQGILTSVNGLVQIGINDDGSLNRFVPSSGDVRGIAYDFGSGNFRDALSPGCYCESWGVAGNGSGGQVGQSTGNSNISVYGAGSTLTSFTSNTELGSTGLTVTQTYTLSSENATGALFKNSIVLTNTTGATITDLRFARAMDWDVPPTEFSEFVTHVGTGTTLSLLRSTDDGFAFADPMSAVSNGGLGAPVDADGTTGPYDHGSLFVFGFGDLLAGQSYKLNIFYGAAGNKAGAISLLSTIAPQLYSLGQSTTSGSAPDDSAPTFIFAFNGVGGDVVVPGVPEASTWAMMLLGFGGLGGMLRSRRRMANQAVA